MQLSMRRIAPILFLGGATLLYFARPLFLGEVLVYRDLAWFHYPLRHLWVSQVRQGLLPYLNPYLNGGQPLLSNPNYSIFYPGNLLYLLLPFDTAWNLVLALHVLWAMCGLYLLARDLDCEPAAAIAGALVFGLGGPLLSCMTYYNILITGAWIPWSLFLFRGALAEKPRHSAWAMATLAALLLAGEPTMLLITASLMAILWMRSPQPLPQRSARLLALAAPPLLAACIQFIPAMMWLPHTSRGEGMDFRLGAAYWSLHPARWIEFLAPRYFGDVMSSLSSSYWGGRLSDGGYPYVLKLYCGWLPWLLVPAAWKRPGGRLALGILATGLVLSLGHRLPGYQLLYQLFLPLRLVRYPEKFLVLAQLGLALITALGLSRVLRDASSRTAFASAAAAGAVLIAASAWAGAFPGHGPAITRSLIEAAAFGLLALGIVWIASRNPKLAWAVPLLLAMDLAPVTLPLAASTPAAEVQKLPSVLKEDPALARACVLHRGEDEPDAYFAGGMEPDELMREALHPFSGLLYGISYGTATDIDRMMWLPSVKRAALLRHLFPSPEAFARMRRCGISRVVSLQEIAEPQLLPEAAVRFPEGNRVFVYRLSGAQPLPASLQDPTAAFEWTDDAPYTVEAHVHLAHADVLRFLRNALPGWSYTLDGRAAAVEADADGFLRLPIPAGAHDLRIEYTPPGLRAGALLCLLGVLSGVFAIRALKQREGQ